MTPALSLKDSKLPWLVLALAIIGVMPWTWFGFVTLEIYPGPFHRQTMALGLSTACLCCLWLKQALKHQGYWAFLLLAYTLSLLTLSERVTTALSLLLLSMASFDSHWQNPSQGTNKVLQFMVIGTVGLIFAHKATGLTYLPSTMANKWLTHGLFLAILLNMSPFVVKTLYGCYPADGTRLPWAAPVSYGAWLAATLTLPEQTAIHSGLYCLSLIWAFQLYRPVGPIKGLKLWTLIAIASSLLGGLLAGLLSSYSVHLIHLHYISGLGLLLLAVPGQLVLDGLRSRWLPWLGSLIVIGSLTRSTAIFLTGSYERHLSYAAMLWVFSLGVIGLKYKPWLRSKG